MDAEFRVPIDFKGDPNDPTDVAAFQKQRLTEVFESGFRPMVHYIDKVRSKMAIWATGKPEGRSTGLRTLDGIVRLIPNELILIPARPSQGKTVLGMQMAENIAIQLLRENDPGVVTIFSAEMAGEDLTIRMASALSGVDAHKLRNAQASQEERERFNAKLDKMEDLPIWIDDSTAPSTEFMMQGLIRVVSSGTPVRLLVFDYVELAGDQNRSEELRIGQIAVRLKAIAKALGIPVIAMTQLNREVEKGESKMPALDHLRYSGMLEQAADKVLFIMRPQYYLDAGQKCYIELPSDRKDTAFLFLAKNRNGPSKMTWRVRFDGALSRFSDLAEVDTLVKNFKIAKPGDDDGD